MPNLLLVHVPSVKLTDCGRNLGAVRSLFPKISQLILAGIVESRLPEWDVRLLDMKTAYQTETHYKTIDYGGKLLDAFRVGLPFEDAAPEIEWADTILLTSNFTQEAGVVADFISFAKSVNPGVRCIVGGSDAMVQRGEVDRHRYYYEHGADFVGGGDGETVLPAVLRDATPPRQSILTDFNEVPLPALHHANLSLYVESHEGGLPDGVHPPLMYLETSRGCRQSCDFCSTPFTKGRYRYMDVDRIGEILQYYRSYGIRTLLLIEDNILSRLDFPGGREAVLEWFRTMHREGFLWEFANGVEIGKLESGGKLDHELIEEMFGFHGSSGCFRSYIPLERIDSSSLPYRKLKVFDIQKSILLAIARQSVPIMNLGVIVGNPEESPESLRSTEERMLELKRGIEDTGGGFAFANIFLHIPICGTNDYRRFHREKRLMFDIDSQPELFNFYTSVVRGDHFDYRELTDLRVEMARRINGEKLMQLWMDGGHYYPDGIVASSLEEGRQLAAGR